MGTQQLSNVTDVQLDAALQTLNVHIHTSAIIPILCVFGRRRAHTSMHRQARLSLASANIDQSLLVMLQIGDMLEQAAGDDVRSVSQLCMCTAHTHAHILQLCRLCNP